MKLKGVVPPPGQRDRGQIGMILPLAMVLLAAASMFVVPGLWYAQSLLTINRNAELDTKSYYAADAGIADVLWRFNTDNVTKPFTSTSSIGSSYSVGSVNGINVTVTLKAYSGDSNTDNYTVQSTASAGSISQPSITALIVANKPGNNIFNQAAAALNGNISMTGGNLILSDNRSSNAGNIYANGNITLTPSAKVGGTCCSACSSCGSGTAAQGIASATGSVTVSACNTGTCVGAAVPNADPVSYTVNVQTFIDQASAGTHYSSNPVPSYGTMNLGPAYITGDLNIAGSVTVHLKGTVYCTGNLHIGGSALVDGPYTIVAGGNVTIDGGSTVKLVAGNIPFIIGQGTTVTIGSVSIAAVIYAPNAAATISGGAGPNGYNVYGSVIAKSITMSGSTVIKYLSGIHSETQIPGTGLGGGAYLAKYDVH